MQPRSAALGLRGRPALAGHRMGLSHRGAQLGRAAARAPARRRAALVPRADGGAGVDALPVHSFQVESPDRSEEVLYCPDIRHKLKPRWVVRVHGAVGRGGGGGVAWLVGRVRRSSGLGRACSCRP